MHKCRDCDSIELSPKSLYCPSCSKKRRRQTTVKWQIQNREKIKANRYKPKPTESIHKCLMCQTTVSGKNKYCTKCKAERQRRFDLKCRESSQLIQDNYTCPTNLNWLDNINAHLKANGGVYVRK